MMDAAVEHRWSRSTYPLQVSFKGSAQPSLGISSQEGMHESPLNRLSMDTQSSIDSAARHPAGTDNRAVSISQRPISSSSSSRDSQSRAGQAEYTSSAAELPKNSQKEDLPVSGTWTRKTYPSGPAMEFAPDRRSSTSTSTSTLAPEDEQGQTTVQVPRPHQSEARKRTLRRTLRSQQIDSPIPAAALKEASLQVRPKEDSQITTVSGTSPWKRGIYPLQPIADGSSMRHSASSPAGEESDLVDRTSLSEFEENKQDARESGARGRRVDSVQSFSSGLTTLPTSPPSSQSGSEDMNEKLTRQQPPDIGQAAHQSKPSRRQIYPLQAPASDANLRDHLTPATSPEREQEHVSKAPVQQTRDTRPGTSSNTAFRRQVYPLQSPASITNLRHSPLPSPSPPPAEREIVQTSEVSADQTQAISQGASKNSSLRRQGYPLQSPASIPMLRRSPSPPPERGSEHVNESSAKQVRDKNEIASKSTAFRRQVYPLQSPASIPMLRRSPSPPPPGERKTQGKDNLTVPSTDRGTQEQDKLSANQSRENKLATKVVNQWHRQVYPVQSPKNVSPFQRSPTPQPPGLEAEREHIARPIHLPKNIAAVTDAEKHDTKGRTIVICLDGTGDKFDNDNSNIVHLISALKKDDPRQVTYYQAGVGTYGEGGLSGGVSAALDMAVGASLGLHVRDAYHFLMHSYKEGDKICIFGFSRGAYTARCLAGMIHKVGLLPPRNIQQISFAYEFYANDTPEAWRQSFDFKRTFCIDISVHFLGCFDSVASVGFIPKQLPLSSTPTNKARYFRHAMALDERRAKFKVCRHQTKDWDDINGVSPKDAAAKAQAKLERLLPNYKSQNDTPPAKLVQRENEKPKHPNVTDAELEFLASHEAPFDTDVLEVWFTGAHADVGGGAVQNDERHKLAQIPLRWMIRQAFECNTGILFKTMVLAEQGLDVHKLWPRYERLAVPKLGPPASFLEKYEKSLPPKHIRRSKLVRIDKHDRGEHFFHLQNHTDPDWTPEQVEDSYDAMSPMNDQLVQAPSWWILELWPVQIKVPISPGKFYTTTGMNLGRYREFEEYVPNLHWTVLHRASHTGHKIEARMPPHTRWRTVV